MEDLIIMDQIILGDNNKDSTPINPINPINPIKVGITTRIKVGTIILIKALIIIPIKDSIQINTGIKEAGETTKINPIKAGIIILIKDGTIKPIPIKVGVINNQIQIGDQIQIKEVGDNNSLTQIGVKILGDQPILTTGTIPSE